MTLTRAVLVLGVAALTAESYVRPAPVKTLVVMSAIALVLGALVFSRSDDRIAVEV